MDARNSPDAQLVRVGLQGPTRGDLAADRLGRQDIMRQDWADQAACLDHDPELFFATDHAAAKVAAGICRTCVVKSECDAAARAIKDEGGIWGAEDRGGRHGVASRRRYMAFLARISTPEAAQVETNQDSAA